MTIVNPDEIYNLAEALLAEQARLINLTGELASLRRTLSQLWPDAKGEEVRGEILKVEELNARADETVRTQIKALLETYESLVQASKVDVSLGGR